MGHAEDDERVRADVELPQGLLVAGLGDREVVDPVGEGDTMGFKLSVTGTNAKIPQAIPPLLGGTPDHAIDAHAIQPFYTQMLAKNCGLSVSMAPEGEAIVVAAK